MILVNELTREENQYADIHREFMKLLNPYAPHIAEEIWATRLGGTGSLNRQSWPVFDPKRVEEDSITVVVQVNGKLRGRLEASKSASKRRAGEGGPCSGVGATSPGRKDDPEEGDRGAWKTGEYCRWLNGHQRGWYRVVEQPRAAKKRGEVSHSFPHLPGKFIGRRDELERLYSILRESVRTSEPRQILILGPAGVGKTRLVHEFLQSG